jgi:wobble nucleotide-excising tRNase
MIESLSIRNIASYDARGIQIKDLKKINVIYGANGTGKTIISNYLASPNLNDYLYCNTVWQHGQRMKSLVYNKSFRESNFGSGKIEGVFTLGQATKEDIETIEVKQEELANLKGVGISKSELIDKLKESRESEENAFKEIAWRELYKKYEVDFKDAFRKSLHKETFKSKVLSEYRSNSAELLDLENLRKKASTIFGDVPQPISLLTKISFDEELEIEKNNIWRQKIIGKSDVDIAKLIQSLNMNDWVNQGRSYLQENMVCPFCQNQTITDKFKKELEDYFDETFEESINKIKVLNDDYHRLTDNITNEITQIETQEKAKKESKLDIDTFSSYIKTLTSQFSSNKESFKYKVKEPSRVFDIVSTEEQVSSIKALITKANEEIIKHNDIVLNFNSEKDTLINSIWKFLNEEFKQEIEAFNKKMAGIEKGIKNLENELIEKRKAYTKLQNKIIELTNNVTSIQPTVNEINRILKTYGFLNFQIVPSELNQNHYQIRREDGTLAETTLSEGEVTFITFLYFLQLAKGSTDKESISEERILVIDDPISSLDSSVLFVVSTLIKDMIKWINEDVGIIKQIILLTHNVYFHKEVSFINGRIKEDRNTLFWILRKKGRNTSIKPYGTKNPINTSYELLWQELKDKEENSRITIQNTMRRIIENYFKILGKYGDDDLIESFETKEEQSICRSLICWINDGSHSISDDLFVELNEDITDKYLRVFKEIFLKTGHQSHYEMMMNFNAPVQEVAA